MLMTTERPIDTGALLSLTPASPSARNELTTSNFAVGGLLAATMISGTFVGLTHRRQVIDRCDYCETTLLVEHASPAGAIDEQAVPIQEIVRNVNVALAGLGKAKIARLVGISRPVFYGWLAGEALNPENSARMRQLARILAVTTQARSPIYRQFLTESLDGCDRSFVDLLKDDPWNETVLTEVAAKARRLSDKREAYLARIRPASRDDGEDNLFDNGLALGLDV